MSNKYKYFQDTTIRFSLILSIISFFLSVIFNRGFEDFAFTFFLPIVFLLSSILFFKKNLLLRENQFLMKLILITFVIKLISIFVFTEIMLYYNTVPFLSYKDDYNYYNSAVEISRLWQVHGISIIHDIKFSTGFYSGYPNVCALVLYYFGESEYYLRIFNSVVSSIIVVVSYRIMRLFFSELSSKISISIVAFSTILIYFSSFIFKDILLLLFTLLSIYGFTKIIMAKVSIASIILILIGLIGIIFFRAATIVPLFISFFISYVFVFFRFKNKFSYGAIFVFFLVVIGFFAIWDYISSYGIIQDSNVYYETRLDSFSGKDINQSGSNVSKIGILTIIGLPVFILSSIFLPSFLFVNLGDAESINYQASALIYHISILPFIIITFFSFVKNFRKINAGLLFLILIIIIFKIGLATSINSLFSIRQSLGAVFTMYLILPAFFDYNLKINSIKIYFCISILLILAYNFLRLYIRL